VNCPDQARLTAEAESLLRLLLCRSPFFAEKGWTFGIADLPRNAWIAIQNPLKTGYMYLGLDGSGRYSATEPVGVAPSEIVRIDDPVEPHFTLRENFQNLVSQVQDQSRRDQLNNIAQLLFEMGTGEFEMKEMNYFFNELFKGFNTKCNPPDAALMAFLEAYIANVHVRHMAYKMPGYFVGSMELLDRAWRPAAYFYLASLSPTGWVGGQHLNQFLLSAFETMRHMQTPEGIKSAADSLHSEGRKLLDDALEVADEIIFYEILYKSCALFRGGAIGFDYVAQRCSTTAEERLANEKMLHTCEEFGIITYTSLISAYDNARTNGARFAADKERVANLAKKDPAAADDLVTQMLELEFLYPNSYRSKLLPS
jgi:hypothetical protein